MFGQRVENLITHGEEASKLTTATLGPSPSSVDRNHFRIGLSRFGKDDFLTSVRALQQLGKMRFRFMDIYGGCHNFYMDLVHGLSQDLKQVATRDVTRLERAV